ncbi:MAG: UDP-N-acetylmuramoyl-L-alanyl-D-glutamate--2,6-diaminopimelate ligase [Clostridia bacterium]|nr:UDP-N-acetylmuramoyl-L-alanyl-D-glutamate--2,6-diaminopimelate ligase [Clostridia bacterium]
MFIKELIVGVKLKRPVDLKIQEIEVTTLTMHSKKCEPGSLFFAIRGSMEDGSNYVADVEVLGAVCVVTEAPTNTSLPQIVVEDVREAMSIISANFYYNAHKELKIIGITGTNGKTSTCKMISEVLKRSGKSVAVFGTLGVFINDRQIPSELTTPDPIDLHRLFQICKLSGVEYVIMEVSAHAMALKKLKGIKFKVVAFTNLTQDHLDFFGTMERYGKAKRELFTPEYSSFQVINADDDFGVGLLNQTEVPFASYGIKNPSDVFAIDGSYTNCLRCVINCFDDIFELYSPISGNFNVYNALCAITVCRLLSVDTATIISAFATMQEVQGRFNVISSVKKVIIDYAHTPDGLKNLLISARALTQGRVIVVFGCGGNRDAKKRSIMGRISAEYADYTVITSDNPRYEEPLDIIRQIESGHREVSNDYITIIDRASAIAYAVTTAREQDVVVIAGKGHEAYIEEKGVKRPYSDKAEVMEILGRLNRE